MVQNKSLGLWARNRYVCGQQVCSPNKNETEDVFNLHILCTSLNLAWTTFKMVRSVLRCPPPQHINQLASESSPCILFHPHSPLKFRSRKVSKRCRIKSRNWRLNISTSLAATLKWLCFTEVKGFLGIFVNQLKTKTTHVYHAKKVFRSHMNSEKYWKIFKICCPADWVESMSMIHTFLGCI